MQRVGLGVSLTTIAAMLVLTALLAVEAPTDAAESAGTGSGDCTAKQLGLFDVYLVEGDKIALRTFRLDLVTWKERPKDGTIRKAGSKDPAPNVITSTDFALGDPDKPAQMAVYVAKRTGNLRLTAESDNGDLECVLNESTQSTRAKLIFGTLKGEDKNGPRCQSSVVAKDVGPKKERIVRFVFTDKKSGIKQATVFGTGVTITLPPVLVGSGVDGKVIPPDMGPGPLTMRVLAAVPAARQKPAKGKSDEDVMPITFGANDHAGNGCEKEFAIADEESGTIIRTAAVDAPERIVFGNPLDAIVVGDWDCDGLDTPGAYRHPESVIYLRNSFTNGKADHRFIIGEDGDVPLAGDFNGDGCDTISLYRPSTAEVFIFNRLGPDGGAAPAPTLSYVYGDPGDQPFVGDFDGNLIDDVGIHRPDNALVLMRLDHATGSADVAFTYGDPDDLLVAGDWNGDGMDTVGVYRHDERRAYLRNSNSAGNADLIVDFPENTWLPVPLAGDFE